MFQLLKTFVTVYETRNFTQAAQQLFLSQPTISLQIKKLEEQLQTSLFIRSGKQEIQPTEEADFFYPRALQILDTWQDTTARLQEKENFREHCTIACSHTCGVYFVPAIVAYLIHHHPHVDFSLQLMNSEEVVHQLEQNKADIGFIEKAVRSELLTQKAIYQDQLILAGDPQSAYWLLRENDSGLRFANENYLKRHNLNPHLVHVNNNEMLLSLLSQGVGQAIISNLSVREDLSWQELPEENQRYFYLMTPKQRFRDIIKHILTSIDGYLAEKPS